MMNRVVATCCCHADTSSNEVTNAGPQVRATDCCEKITTAARSATVRGPRDGLLRAATGYPDGDGACPHLCVSEDGRVAHAVRAGSSAAGCRSAVVHPELFLLDLTSRVPAGFNCEDRVLGSAGEARKRTNVR